MVMPNLPFASSSIFYATSILVFFSLCSNCFSFLSRASFFFSTLLIISFCFHYSSVCGFSFSSSIRISYYLHFLCFSFFVFWFGHSVTWKMSLKRRLMFWAWTKAQQYSFILRRPINVSSIKLALPFVNIFLLPQRLLSTFALLFCIVKQDFTTFIFFLAFCRMNCKDFISIIIYS